MIKKINFADINKNFVIRVEDTHDYYRVIHQGHTGKFFTNKKYKYSHSIQRDNLESYVLLDENNMPFEFFENEISKVKKETSLHSARTYVLLIGEELANKHFTEVLNNGEYKTTYKLRRGITVNFCSK